MNVSFIGEPRAGISSLISRVNDNSFTNEIFITEPITKQRKLAVTHNGSHYVVNLDLYDFPHSSKVFPESNGVIITIDPTNPDCFRKLLFYIQAINQRFSASAIPMIIFTKHDLMLEDDTADFKKNIKSNVNKIKVLANRQGWLTPCWVSAKTGYGESEETLMAFYRLATEFITKIFFHGTPQQSTSVWSRLFNQASSQPLPATTVKRFTPEEEQGLWSGVTVNDTFENVKLSFAHYPRVETSRTHIRAAAAAAISTTPAAIPLTLNNITDVARHHWTAQSCLTGERLRRLNDLYTSIELANPRERQIVAAQLSTWNSNNITEQLIENLTDQFRVLEDESVMRAILMTGNIQTMTVDPVPATRDLTTLQTIGTAAALFQPTPQAESSKLTFDDKLNFIEEYDKAAYDNLKTQEITGYRCRISLELMHNPVMSKYGHSYERKTIEQYLKTEIICPFKTGPLSKQDLFPNIDLQEAIERYCQEIDRVYAEVKARAEQQTSVVP